MSGAELRGRFAALGIALPRILLPSAAIDPARFAVIACDQHSARPEYWREVRRVVGDAPSALPLILPEAWLDGKAWERGIVPAMKQYLEDGVFTEQPPGFVFVRRRTAAGVRRGLVMAFDLEEYVLTGAGGLIRPTEATVMERLPARIDIRKDAPLELPHIMILIDDKSDALLSMLDGHAAALPLLYDFELMLGGGHIEGRAVQDAAALADIAGALETLKAGCGGMLYAMGDGNHSFAAARACWDAVKPGLAPDERGTHPARYALAELVNLHDPAMAFEPIHRALLGVDPDAVQREAGFDAGRPPELETLQPLLDRWLAAHPQAELEYIHGEAECRALCDAPDRLAVILPEFDKNTLFDRVRRTGTLARKSFSIGQASDKRYYLEARKIR